MAGLVSGPARVWTWPLVCRASAPCSGFLPLLGSGTGSSFCGWPCWPTLCRGVLLLLPESCFPTRAESFQAWALFVLADPVYNFYLSYSELESAFRWFQVLQWEPALPRSLPQVCHVIHISCRTVSDSLTSTLSYRLETRWGYPAPSSWLLRTCCASLA